MTRTLVWYARGLYLAALYLAEPWLVAAPAPIQRAALALLDALDEHWRGGQ
jgi:hypothetical protein